MERLLAKGAERTPLVLMTTQAPDTLLVEAVPSVAREALDMPAEGLIANRAVLSVRDSD